MLLRERARLREEIENLATGSIDSGVGVGNHMADDATAAFDQAAAVSLLRSQQLTLELVEKALGRMEDGSYGLCVRCTEPIDFARLKAIPHATLCMACQKLAEL